MQIKIFEGGEDERARLAAQLVPLFLKSRAMAMPWLPVVRRFDEVLSYFKDHVLAEQKVALALDQGTLAGFAAWQEAELNHLYLAPQYQSQGFGGRLLDLAKDGKQALELWAFQGNTPALKFYEKHGFKVIRATDGSENEEKTPDYRLRWEAPS